MAVLVGIIIFLLLNSISTYSHFSYWISDNPEDTSKGDLANWASIVIEGGIGTFITGMIFMYERIQNKRSSDQQTEISKLVNEIQNMENTQLMLDQKLFDMIEKQSITTRNRKNFVYYKIIFELIELLEGIKKIRSAIPENGETYPYPDDALDSYLSYLNDPMDSPIQNIQNMIELSNDVIDAEMLYGLFTFIKLTKTYRVTGYDNIIRRNNLDFLIPQLDDLIGKITLEK